MPSAPAPPQRLFFIDRIRGIGMLLILLYHAMLRTCGEKPLLWNGYWWDPHGYVPWLSAFNLSQQWLQVPSMFFLFSGFLVHRSLSKRVGEGASGLLIRRGMRLYIPYLVALVGYAFIWPRTRIPFDGDGAWDAALHLLLLHNTNDTTLFSINASFWYVATELQLCALYPLVMLATRRFGWRQIALALLVLDVTVRLSTSLLSGPIAQGDLSDEWILRSPLVYAIPWYAGAWIADLQRTGQLHRPRVVWKWVLPLGGLAATVAWPLTAFAQLFMSLTFAVWFAAAIASRTGTSMRAKTATQYRPSLLGRATDRVGMLGLGIYLLNQPLVNEIHWRVAAHFAGPFAQITLTASIALMLLLPAAWIMARVIEEPLARKVDALMNSLKRTCPPSPVNKSPDSPR